MKKNEKIAKEVCGKHGHNYVQVQDKESLKIFCTRCGDLLDHVKPGGEDEVEL